jgi:hypothetical protein
MTLGGTARAGRKRTVGFAAAGLEKQTLHPGGAYVRLRPIADMIEFRQAHGNEQR